MAFYCRIPMNLLRHRYIAIEGAIGAGKTSLAEILAETSQAQLVLENLEENPFLPKFYQNMDNYAFQMQLFFLLSRYNQQRELLQQDLFYDCVICDYLFAKDRIFAYLNLDEDELILYERLYGFFNEAIPKPDLVIYLQASTDVLMDRIKRRGRHYEKNISRDYLRELNERYNSFFSYYSQSPLLVVNTDSLDFINNEEDLLDLIDEIKRMKGGKEYYVLTKHR